jgi:hypothetical protein
MSIKLNFAKPKPKTVIQPHSFFSSNNKEKMHANNGKKYVLALQDKLPELVFKKDRGSIWKILNEACGILGREPKVRWPKGSLSEYVDELEDIFESCKPPGNMVACSSGSRGISTASVKPAGNNYETTKLIRKINKCMSTPEHNWLPSPPRKISKPPGYKMEPPAPITCPEPPGSPEFDPFASDSEEETKNPFPIVPIELILAERREQQIKDQPKLPSPHFSPLALTPPLNDEVPANCFGFASPPPVHSSLKQPVNKSPQWKLWDEQLVQCYQRGLNPASPLPVCPSPLPWDFDHPKNLERESKTTYRKPETTRRYNRFHPRYQNWVAKRMNRTPPPPCDVEIVEPVLNSPVIVNETPVSQAVLDKADEIKRNIKPDIKLLGGVLQAVPPHLRAGRHRIHRLFESIVSDSVRNFFGRNVVHRVGRVGAGLQEHHYVFRNGTEIASTPVMVDFASKLGLAAMHHSVEYVHGGQVPGVYPKMQFVFHNRHTGKFKRSKLVDSSRQAIGGSFWDDLEEDESDPWDDSQGGSLKSIRVLVPEHPYRGGCDSRQHTINFTDYKVRTMKSSGNNCGIACLLYKSGIKKYAPGIRRAVGLAEQSELGFEDMEKVAAHLKCGFRIWGTEQTILSVIHSFGLQRERVVDILYNAVTKHYSILILLNEKQQCTLCGKFLRSKENHKCPSRRVNYFRHYHKLNMEGAAEFKEVDEEMRDLNRVFVFDLETFPLRDDIHVPYACKMQNVGTKEEWLRYGQHGELLIDILEQSSRGIPIHYEDENPGFATGMFRYKVHSTDRGWKKMKYVENLTQEEAVIRANIMLDQLMDIPANRHSGLLADNNTQEKCVYLYHTIPEKVEVARFSYDDSCSKENVEAKLKAMKDWHPCVFVAHNLARFDGSFLLNYLLEKSIDVRFVINGGRILGLQWNNSKVWDSCLFITDSLKNIAINFKCAVQKGDFDHTLIKSWADVYRYKEKAENNDMGWGPYLDCDVYSLREIVEKYATNVHQQFKADVFNYVTLSSMTYKLWGATTLSQNVVIETPQEEKYDFVKDSIYGGRVFPMHKHFATNALNAEEEKELQRIYSRLDNQESLDDIKYDPEDVKAMYQKIWDSGNFLINMDMNSLYPTAMCLDMPVGMGEWSTHPQADFEKGYMGMFHISFEAPKHLVMAILPQRNKPWVSGKEDAKLNKQWKASGIKWSLEDSEGVYTSVDIQMALQYGYKITFKQKAFIWKDKAPVFKSYIEEIYKIKKQQDLLEGTPEYNQIIRSIAKSMMNSLFGKTCQRPIQDEQKIIHNEAEYYEFCERYLMTDYVWVKQDGKDVLAASGSPAVVENSKPSHLGAFILAYSRKLMTEDFERCTAGMKQANFTYTDTDSIHMLGTAYKDMLVKHPERFGSELGQFSNDIKGKDPIIVAEYCLAPKCYMYVYIDKAGKVGLKKKVKGVPKCVMKKISVEDFKNEREKRLDFESLKKNMFNQSAPFSIQNVKAHRTFLKNKWSKMLYDETTKQFRPFGFDESVVPAPVVQPEVAQEAFDLSKYEAHGIRNYGMDDVDWYFKQEPALHMPGERLVKWVNQRPKQVKPVHHFSRMSVSQMQQILEANKHKGSKLYEVTEDFVRLYCDVDLKRGTRADIEPEVILEEVLEVMRKAADHFGVTLQEEDFRITSACSDKKYSFHIVCPSHVFPTAGHQKEYWETCVEESKNYPDLFHNEESCFDIAVYHQHRAMRTIYSCKPNGPVLVPVDAKMEPLFDIPIEEYFICVSKHQFDHYSKLSREPKVVRVKRAAGVHIVRPKATLDPYVQKLLAKNKHLLEGFDLVNGEMLGNMVRLDRIGGGTCSSCKRNHDHENGYVKFSKKAPYFVCYRDTKTKIPLSLH